MLVVHLLATAVLAGIGWVVQLVVYPAFALVGDAEWAAYHRAHQRSIAQVVLLPWLAQGVTAVGLAFSPLARAAVATLGALALAGVALTVWAAVPAHGRLGPRAAADLRRLRRANLARTLAWTGSAALSAALVGATA